MRKIAGITLMVLLALLIAACGADDEEDDPTAEVTETVAATGEAEGTATEAATEDAAVGADPGTPIAASTPAAAATPATVASPAADATPVIVATPAADATPVGSGAAAIPAGATPDSATPAAVSGASISLSGQVVLPGTLNETFVIAENGCVGLNGYSDMRAGRQLVVRDQDGTIVGVTTLRASDATDTCAWDFSIDVPESSFYAVSIPMEVEHVFTSEDIEQNGGEIEVPLR
ncbi:MAG TPA: hypothetical protein VD789_03395 [Thermomicrobiales bacterium]|nr:hypothetical protein [Thermomicrobiales bacterium]